jgi:hypothetical protein
MHKLKRVADMFQLLKLEVGNVDGKSADQSRPVWRSEIQETLGDVTLFHSR